MSAREWEPQRIGDVCFATLKELNHTVKMSLRQFAALAPDRIMQFTIDTEGNWHINEDENPYRPHFDEERAQNDRVQDTCWARVTDQEEAFAHFATDGDKFNVEGF